MIKSNNPFWLLSRITSVLAIFGLLLVVSCGKDDEEPKGISIVQFTNEAQTIAENGTTTTINIPFDKAAARSGTITVTLTEGTGTIYGTHFSTSPNGTTGSIDIEVAKGQTSAQFTVSPVNNGSLADDKSVVFTISEVTSGFEIGTKDSNTITITDDEGPTAANFATASSTTVENLSAGIDVTINLTNAAPGAGTITVGFTSTTAVYTTNFTTEPAATAGEFDVAVAEGATSVKFKVKPVDDGSVNATREITFTLTEATGAVVLGTAITEHDFSITDNETPSVATFDEEDGSVSEGNEEGIEVPVTFTPTTNGTGTLVITFAGAEYGDDFATEPAAVDGKITLNVATSAATASFTVIPTDDSEETANREITFTLSQSTGIVTLGASDKTFDLTIEDDDAVETIAEVRADFPGTTTDITTSKKIHGVVTSSNPQVNTNNIWVQDATGGIVVRLVAANNNAIKRGDEVTIELNGGQYLEFFGLLQVQNVPNANVVVDNQDVTLPAPEVITVAQLNSGAFEGKLVRINDVAFVDANGTATMSGTRVVSNGTVSTNVRTEATAPHTASVLPYGFGTITGLAGENVGAQIIPISFADDVFASTVTGNISITQSLTDFGTVNNAAESASQSYTVTGVTLTHDIVITPSGGYKVSTNNVDFSTSATLSPVGGTVYVKFAPATGVNQVIAGTITHKSLGVASAVVNVTGTEAGNVAGGGTLMIYEVYGAGGNGGATYNQDYVVLYNGTSASIDLSTYSVHYSSATGTFGAANNSVLGGTIEAGKYFLIKLASGVNGSSLPTITAEFSTANTSFGTPINMAAGAGVIALVKDVNIAVALTGAADSRIGDLVGFGSTATKFEGTGPTEAPSATKSVQRKNITDTNNNANDFQGVSPPNLAYLQ